MTATWRTPVTWTVGQLVTATNLNEQLRDNLEFLKTPPTALHHVNQASDYTTTSTSFVDVDATNLSLTIVTAGGDVMIGFTGTVDNNGAGKTYLDVAVDSVRMGGDDGLQAADNNAITAEPMILCVLKQGLAPGSHTFKLQWKVQSGTSTLYAGAGTTNLDLHPQFWVREV
jgi:hypothetical protein